jgi:two-component system, OmpR family, response regulator PhoP
MRLCRAAGWSGALGCPDGLISARPHGYNAGRPDDRRDASPTAQADGRASSRRRRTDRRTTTTGAGVIRGGIESRVDTSALRVALVEDDTELRDAILAPALTESGFDVAVFGNAAGLYRSLLHRSFDVVVLDVGLPDEDGFDVARYLRSLSSIGIVMLTGRATSPDRVRGLRHGADAYLTKPLDLDVLKATLHSLSRRLVVEDTHRVAAGTWRLGDGDWNLLAPDDVCIDLTASERSILRTLFDAKGQPVPREALIGCLTADVYDFDPHRLEMLVHRLRRKVSVGSRHPLPLRAVRGKGYVLAVAQAGKPAPLRA